MREVSLHTLALRFDFVLENMGMALPSPFRAPLSHGLTLLIFSDMPLYARVYICLTPV